MLVTSGAPGQVQPEREVYDKEWWASGENYACS